MTVFGISVFVKAVFGIMGAPKYGSHIKLQSLHLTMHQTIMLPDRYWTIGLLSAGVANYFPSLSLTLTTTITQILSLTLIQIAAP